MPEVPSALHGQAAVTDAIRQAILVNDLAPGQRLVEADLCQMLGTSRGTLRAALTDLANEGLVERIANRGARVRIVGLEEALQIVDVRLAVESHCIAEAIARITDAEIGELRQLAARLEKAASNPEGEPFAELTRTVFNTYVRIAANPVAQEILERLRDRLTRHRLRLTYRPGRPQVSVPYWLEIIDAICRRDTPDAQDALRRHVANIKATMRELSRNDLPVRR